MAQGLRIRTVVLLSLLMPVRVTQADDNGFDKWDQRDVWQLRFTGNETFASSDIRNAIALDGQVQSNANPAIPVAGFHASLKQRIADGYRSRGFDDVRVNIRGAGTEEPVTVHVTEGPRYRCGQIRVTGWSGPDAEKLVRRITLNVRTEQHQTAKDDDSDNDTDAHGLWRVGHPVAFTNEYTEAVQKRALAIMKKAGFHFANLSVGLQKDTKSTTAVLCINVSDPGPRQKVREIRFTGLKRHTADELLQLLDLPEELTATEALHQQIQDRLIATGRFVYVRTALETPFGPDQILPLFIHVREFEDIPKLGEPLTPAQEALVGLANYTRRLSKSKEDLTFEFRTSGLASQLENMARGASGKDVSWPTSIRPDAVQLRLTLSGAGGGILHAKATRKDQQTIINASIPFIVGHLGAVNHANKSRWICERMPFGGIVSLSLDGHEPDEDGHQFNFNVGAGVSSTANEPLQTLIRANPAALIDAFTEINDLETKVTDNSTLIKWSLGHIEINRTTGALQSMRMELDGAVLTGRSGSGILNAQIDKLRSATASWANLWSKESGLAGLVSFAAASCEALMNSVDEPSSPLTELLLTTLQDRSLFDRIQNQLESLNSESGFSIPCQQRPDAPGITQTWQLHALKGLVPTGSAPHRLAAAILHAQSSGESAALGCLLTELVRNPDHGPATCLLAGIILRTHRAPLARIGLHRLETEKLPVEIETVLRNQCVITNIVTQVIDSVRTMNDNDFQRLTTLITHSHTEASQNGETRKIPAAALLLPLHIIRSYPSDDPHEIAVAFAGGVWKIWGREQLQNALLSWLPEEESERVFRQASQSSPFQGSRNSTAGDRNPTPLDLPQPNGGSFFKKPTKIK